MQEDFLHFIWKFGLFTTTDLNTTCGRKIEVVYPGIHNHNSGPDFQEARLIIDGIPWNGHVEIHIRASDWIRHGHHHDDAYNNVILHAVHVPDRDIFLKKPGDLPVLDMSQFMLSQSFDSYRDLAENLSDIPCYSKVASVRELTVRHWLGRLAVHRMSRKTEAIMERLEINNGNWRETFYQVMGIGFGFKVNAHAFQFLTESLPLGILERHAESRFQIEALLFGQAGFLNEPVGERYPDALHNEYDYLRRKLKMSPISLAVWKRSRMRPTNFPELRIAQFSALIYHMRDIFRIASDEIELSELKVMLDLDIHPYWTDHSGFGRSCKPRKVQLGTVSKEILMINTLTPFLFAWGRFKNRRDVVDRAMTLLESCEAENNKVIRRWKAIGIEAESASDSQALLELRNEFCAYKKCLNCMIGVELMRKSDP